MNHRMRLAALALLTACLVACNKQSDPPAPPTPGEEPNEEAKSKEEAPEGEGAATKPMDGPVDVNAVDISAHDLLKTLRDVTGKPIRYKKKARKLTECARVTVTGEKLTREEFEARVVKALDDAGLKLEQDTTRWLVDLKPGASPCKK